MGDVPTPHDRFFRERMAVPAIAVDFLATYLPPALRTHLDLTTVKAGRETFVDPNLDLGHTDLLLHANMVGGGEAAVYLLFEHKSRQDRWVSLQLLSYMTRIWKHWRRQGRKGRLPPILPIVRILRLLAADLRGRGRQAAIEAIDALTSYLGRATGRLTPGAIERAVLTAFPGEGEKTMETLQDIWINKGRVEGRVEGALVTGRDAILDVLSARFEGVPADLVRDLGRVEDLERLKVLLRRAVLVSSLEEFVGQLRRG